MESCEIFTMVEFMKNHKQDFLEFKHPETPGVFRGKLIALHWAVHAIIHSFWLLDDGAKLDCVLFKDKDYCNVMSMDIGDYAQLYLERSSSGRVYIRKLELND